MWIEWYKSPWLQQEPSPLKENRPSQKIYFPLTTLILPSTSTFPPLAQVNHLFSANLSGFEFNFLCVCKLRDLVALVNAINIEPSINRVSSSGSNSKTRKHREGRGTKTVAEPWRLQEKKGTDLNCDERSIHWAWKRFELDHVKGDNSLWLLVFRRRKLEFSIFIWLVSFKVLLKTIIIRACKF